MGSKANDSRMGTTGLPSTSGISFRLTPAPEAVIKTSSAPTRTGSARPPSAVARPPAAPARSRVRRWVACAELLMGTILLAERARRPTAMAALGTVVAEDAGRYRRAVESLGRGRRHVLDGNQIN